VAVSPASQAGFIDTVSVDIKPTAPGLYDSTYTLAVSPMSTISAYEFALNVDTSSNLQSLVTPTGWDVTYNPGDTSITWSTDNFPVTPGTSDIFGFASALPPVAGTYQTLGFDPDQFQFYPDQGSISVPGVASTTEPGSLVLSGIGALGLLMIHVWRHRIR
jgi:hypothetical protein